MTWSRRYGVSGGSAGYCRPSRSLYRSSDDSPMLAGYSPSPLPKWGCVPVKTRAAKGGVGQVSLTLAMLKRPGKVFGA